MARSRSRTADYAVYFALRVVGCLLQILSPERALRIVHDLAALAFWVDRRHREVALNNLRLAFPGRHSERQLHQLVREVYRHFGRFLLEMLLMPRKLGRHSWRHYLNLPDCPEFHDAMAAGRPILIVTAHYGSWELAPFYLSLVGLRAHLVARPLDNPYLDAVVRRFRERTGHTVLAKNGDLRRMHEVLAAGGTICTLVDQDAGERGLFVEFFGRPASTHKVIAHLAKRTSALVFVGCAENTGGLLRYAMRFVDVIRPEDYDGRADAVHAITQRVTAAVERMVRNDPRQYLWLHRRWKHQPSESRQAA